MSKQSSKYTAAIKKLAAQIDGNDSHTALLFAVVKSAISDLKTKSYRASAVIYINGDMVHAQLIGLDPVWIREVLGKLGIDYSTINKRQTCRH